MDAHSQIHLKRLRSWLRAVCKHKMGHQTNTPARKAHLYTCVYPPTRPLHSVHVMNTQIISPLIHHFFQWSCHGLIFFSKIVSIVTEELLHHLQIHTYSIWHPEHLKPLTSWDNQWCKGEWAVNQTEQKVHRVWWLCLVFLQPEAHCTPAPCTKTGVGLQAVHYQWGGLQHDINHGHSNQPHCSVQCTAFVEGKLTHVFFRRWVR